MMYGRVHAIYNDCENLDEHNFIGRPSFFEEVYLAGYKFFDVQLKIRVINSKFLKREHINVDKVLAFNIICNSCLSIKSTFENNLNKKDVFSRSISPHILPPIALPIFDRNLEN